jgi:uncharacterized metal-binding protein
LTHVHHLNLVSDFFLFAPTAYLICGFPLKFVYFLTHKANRQTFMFGVHVTLMYAAILIAYFVIITCIVVYFAWISIFSFEF